MTHEIRTIYSRAGKTRMSVDTGKESAANEAMLAAGIPVHVAKIEARNYAIRSSHSRPMSLNMRIAAAKVRLGL